VNGDQWACPSIQQAHRAATNGALWRRHLQFSKLQLLLPNAGVKAGVQEKSCQDSFRCGGGLVSPALEWNFLLLLLNVASAFVPPGLALPLPES
jgi:hypothetical protein